MSYTVSLILSLNFLGISPGGLFTNCHSNNTSSGWERKKERGRRDEGEEGRKEGGREEDREQ